MGATFMGAVMRGDDPRDAWMWYRGMLLAEEQQRDLVRQLAASEGGRRMLDESRAAWRARGLEAPFDDLPGPGGRPNLGEAHDD